MSMTTKEAIRQRLLAHILPRRAKTAAQEEAMDEAVDQQAAYEAAAGMWNLPAGVTSISNDGVSIDIAQGSGAPSYSKDTISPVAWSILRNAGLIAYTLPTARKP